MIHRPAIRVLQLFISPGHNYFGHHGQPAAKNPTMEVPEICIVAGRGIEGDRFFDYKDDYKGQVTFFDQAVYEQLCAELGVQDKSPAVFRRNVITSGVDLRELVGQEFELQGLRFRGTEECRPCYWMDSAFGPGAEQAMKGRGGLRVQALTSGVLRVEG